jgi:DNA-binding NarL/FixJ family response regulator
LAWRIVAEFPPGGGNAHLKREIQVLQLVARGNRKQVAAQLSIAEETVRMHMNNILGKLAANDRTHAVTIAVTRGILRLWEAIGAGAAREQEASLA